LRAALLDPDRALPAWREWTARVDVDDLDWDCQRVLPLLYRNIAPLGVDSPDMDRMKGVYRHYWYGNQLLLRDAAGALRALHGVGIETVVLKGLALSTLHYHDGGTRPMADVDVLVRPSDVKRALSVLADAGYSPYATRSLDLQLRTRHAICVRNGADRPLDLHWYALFQSAGDEDFWDAAVPLEVAGVSTRALCPADQLLHVCVHGLSWASPAPIRWLTDAATVIRSSAGALDWDRLVERALARECTVTLSAALGHLTRLLEVPVPREVIERLGRARPSRIERLAHALSVRGTTHGAFYLLHWDRYRRLRRAGAPGVQRNYVAYVRDCWDVDSLGAMGRVLASKAVQIARYGQSIPAELGADEASEASSARPRAA
jgi:hypothetical protein